MKQSHREFRHLQPIRVPISIEKGTVADYMKLHHFVVYLYLIKNIAKFLSVYSKHYEQGIAMTNESALTFINTTTQIRKK